jgi:hypothetical protein
MIDDGRLEEMDRRRPMIDEAIGRAAQLFDASRAGGSRPDPDLVRRPLGDAFRGPILRRAQGHTVLCSGRLSNRNRGRHSSRDRRMGPGAGLRSGARRSFPRGLGKGAQTAWISEMVRDVGEGALRCPVTRRPIPPRRTHRRQHQRQHEQFKPDDSGQPVVGDGQCPGRSRTRSMACLTPTRRPWCPVLRSPARRHSRPGSGRFDVAVVRASRRYGQGARPAKPATTSP